MWLCDLIVFILYPVFLILPIYKSVCKVKVALKNPYCCPATCSTSLYIQYIHIQDVLGNISIHVNVDGPEGGLDGVVQVLTCQEVLVMICIT